ncbi:MAG: hybrid sensor histidine kinase/response regulator [Acidimicrobiales bacterium]
MNGASTVAVEEDEGPPRPRVLLVDDRPENLLAVEAVLEPLRLDLVSVRSGEEALRRLLAEEFAVIVLDVQMPVLDGFETARLIKGRERTRHVPIIFLTAISGGLDHHLKGYAAGAVDYVYKPFEPDILRAKVAVLAELWERGVLIDRQRAELAVQLTQLSHAHHALADQAVELERSNAALDQFAQVAAHDLVDPLHTVAGFLDLLRTGDGLPDDAALLAERAAAGVDRARTLVGDLLTFARASSGDLVMEDVALADALADARAQVGGKVRGEGAVSVDGDLPAVHADRRMVVLLLAELLRRASASAGDDVAVAVSASVNDAVAHVAVADNGPKPGAADLARLFTVFAGGAGAGLALCRRIVERHGTSIGCDPGADRGATVWFTLPAARR